MRLSHCNKVWLLPLLLQINNKLQFLAGQAI
uniref:Uncharacterized protein n=1 Tax=Rhizophora mucronata TaxID=61149 RepID=A0A2P2PU32_RHIMU